MVAPLDWGLGHATRCIPIIRFLTSEIKCQVILAANGPQRALLAESFPGLKILEIPDYKVSYSKKRTATILKLSASVPSILRAIRREHAWLRTVVTSHGIDVVISDNRYGLFHPGIPCHFITHQLLVKTPLGPWADRLLQKQLYRFINRFSSCWVPDDPVYPGLAGELSHPAKLPSVPIHYLGPLSRIQPGSFVHPPKPSIDLLVLLSGPEPQRSLLEDQVLKELKKLPGLKVVLVRGLPGTSQIPPTGPDIQVFNHLATPALIGEIANARSIVSRSGYSTIMDLLPLGKDCIMVPTPGQTEQEYLAKLHSSTGRIRSFHQDQLDLVSLFGS
ncbi:glycosyl transferase family 28 [Flavihumibacter rivuli]|uniref:glycosyltransferase n=1 Tax=Flavihumibacter rivuli TaxID=2838156 RepID=UPI001BDF036B|nr:glycosyltransferase [Flavihumibacter rivuli]ULQ55764.1 glycosyl transferase family 28 [Flavihumibacter rivuli]